MSSTNASYREITDANDRVYRVGETDRELLGRSRAWMVWLPWAAMMAISVYEYGYGAAAKSLRDAHHWTMSETFWLLSIWAFFQALVALSRRKAPGEGHRLGQDCDVGRRGPVGGRLRQHRQQRQPGHRLPRVLRMRRHRRRPGLRDVHQPRRKVVPGAARRQDRVRQRRIRLRRCAIHLHLQLRPASEHLCLGSRPGRRVHADRRRGMRTAVPGPAEELVAVRC